MLRQRLIVLAITPVAALLAGCVEPEEGLTLTADDHGSAVTVSIAECFIVSLRSNATTGYAWQIAEMDPVILENTGQEYVQDIAPPGMAGVGGTENWEFVGRVAGSSTLRLEYRRSWEPEDIEPAETFQVDVTVVAAE